MKGKFLLPCLVLLLAAACRGRPWKQKLIYSYSPVAIYSEERKEGDSSPPPGFSHPAQVPEDKLKDLFESLQYNTWGLFKGDKIEPVFAGGEIESLMAPLVAALKNVKPEQRIRFLVARTSWKVLGAKGVSGVIFFTNPRQMNVAFDLLNDRLSEESGDPRSMVFWDDPVEITGKKTEIIPPEGAVLREDDRGILHPRWVVVNLDEFPVNKVTPSPEPREIVPPPEGDKPPEPASDPKVEEIKRKLENLKKLREDGTISEEEYQRIRQEILLQKSD